jgi:HK97 family phage prohead protease
MECGGLVMVVRNKGGEVVIRNSLALLDFLRGLKTHAGKPADDIEIVTAVPFREKDGEEESRTGIAWTFSTFDLDRFSERIDPEGWDFANCMKNPVVEWAHRYDIPAIGKADNLFTDENGLHGRVIFNDKDYDAFGWGIGQRVKAGVIRAGSVGFRVLEIEIPEKAMNNERGAKSKGDGTVLIFRKQELLEFSICNVPANPFALAKGLGANKAAGFPDFWGNIITNHTGGNNG